MNIRNPLELPLPRNALPVIGIVLTLLWLLWLGYGLVTQMPTVYVLEKLRLTPSANSITLGATALGQHPDRPASAARQHLQAQYDTKKQAWSLANVSNKNAQAQCIGETQASCVGGEIFELRRIRLQTGDALQFGDTHLKVEAVGARNIQLTSDTPPFQANWDGQRLQVSGQENFGHCPHSWKPYFPSGLLPYMPLRWQQSLGIDGFTVGGKVQCHDRLAVPGIPFNTARIASNGRDMFLYPQPQTDLRVWRGGKPLDTDETGTPASTLQSVILGKTHYDISETDNVKSGKDLILQPIINTVHHGFTQVPPNEGLAVTGTWSAEPQALGSMFLPNLRLSSEISAALLLLAGIWLAIAVPIWRHDLLADTRKTTIRLALLLPLAGLWVANHLLAIHLSGLLGLTWLMWVWASTVLWETGYLRSTQVAWLWLVVILVIGIGTLTLAQLGAGADTSRQLGFAFRHMQLLIATAFLICLLGLIPFPLLQRGWGWLVTTQVRWWLLGGLLAFMLLQSLFGDEKGLWGFQPLEAAKTVLVLLLAGVVLNWQSAQRLNALEWRENRSHWMGRFLRIIAVVTITLGAVASWVHDFSPLLIVGGLLIAYTGHYAPRRWRWGVAAFVAGVFVGGVALYQHPTWLEWLMWLPQPERLLVWVQPWQYPDTGHQLQLALQATHAEGNGWGGMGCFGNNGAIMDVPVLQSDFILTFFLHKAGGIAGIVLLTLQLIWLGIMIQVASQLPMPAESNAREQRLPALFLSYAVFGMAWMQALHWLISWGNALGVLPVMGQPMTWMSSGNSHLLAVGVPSLLLTLLAAMWLNQTKSNNSP